MTYTTAGLENTLLYFLSAVFYYIFFAKDELDWVPGIVVYYDNKKIYMVDKYALGDPLLSKLPVVYVDNWRVGHTYRMIPEGYRESLATMTIRLRINL